MDSRLASSVQSEPRVIRVIALDDNPGDLALFEHHMRSIEVMDFDLKLVGCSADLIAALASESFEMAFLDYQLAKVNGVELFESIDALGRDVPAVLLTGQDDIALVARALRVGFDDYLPKSTVSSSSLERTIRNILEKRAYRQSAELYRLDLEASVRRLESQNREISSFYHTLAHELKTPLTAAREYAAIVHDGLAGPVTPAQLEHLQTAMRACDQLHRCIEDLFDVSRIETGKLQVVPDQGSLTHVVEQCVARQRSRAAEAGIQLVLKSLPKLDPIQVDVQRLSQIVSNLITNAIKFSPQGSVVEVSCAKAGPTDQLIRVSDNGPGIAAADLENVFERLYQGRGHATVTGGMGLGLHLSRELARLHGGDLTVESEVGMGSTFTVRLPQFGPTDAAPTP